MTLVKRKVANGDDGPTPRKKRKPKDRTSGPAALQIIPVSGSDGYKSRAEDKRPRVPNPWPPNDIVTLLMCACVYPTVKAVFELIKLWVDDRKARKIRIKNGDIEIEIQGGITTRTLKKRLDEFRRLTKEMSEDDIKIILPSGIDRTLPNKDGRNKTAK